MATWTLLFHWLIPYYIDQSETRKNEGWNIEKSKNRIWNGKVEQRYTKKAFVYFCIFMYIRIMFLENVMILMQCQVNQWIIQVKFP